MSCVGVMYQPYSTSSYLTSVSSPAQPPPPPPPTSTSPSAGYPEHLGPLPLKREISEKVGKTMSWVRKYFNSKRYSGWYLWLAAGNKALKWQTECRDGGCLPLNFLRYDRRVVTSLQSVRPNCKIYSLLTSRMVLSTRCCRHQWENIWAWKMQPLSLCFHH